MSLIHTHPTSRNRYSRSSENRKIIEFRQAVPNIRLKDIHRCFIDLDWKLVNGGSYATQKGRSRSIQQVDGLLRNHPHHPFRIDHPRGSIDLRSIKSTNCVPPVAMHLEESQSAQACRSRCAVRIPGCSVLWHASESPPFVGKFTR